ncbi:MAG: hypothetical protein JNM10_02955 [Planctomycetia bacterium]|nr:hypothetical protein [Planctomycetia bacterium]
MTQTQAFLLTLAIEVPVVCAGAWASAAPRATWGRLPFVAIAASALTHPLLWLVDPALAPHVGPAVRWAVLETTIAVVEGLGYAYAAGLGVRRGLALGFLANAVSFGVGLWIYYG